MRVTLEIAVSTPDEAVTAIRAGADRLELATILELGGLTPSLGMFQRVRELVTAPIWVMLRPRPGGFNCTREELEVMMHDAETFLAAGADGLVVGVLDETGRIAVEPCGELAKLAGGRVVFHRAFDFTEYPGESLEQLIALGFRRILTSGGKKTARDGSAAIADLIRLARDRIEILPGGGILPDNVARLVRTTGCNQVHAAARSLAEETLLLRDVDLARAIGSQNLNATRTDPELVAGLRRELDRFPSIT